MRVDPVARMASALVLSFRSEELVWRMNGIPGARGAPAS